MAGIRARLGHLCRIFNELAHQVSCRQIDSRLQWLATFSLVRAIDRFFIWCVGQWVTYADRTAKKGKGFFFRPDLLLIYRFNISVVVSL